MIFNRNIFEVKYIFFLLTSSTMFTTYAITCTFNGSQNITILNGKIFINGKELQNNASQEITISTENCAQKDGSITVHIAIDFEDTSFDSSNAAPSLIREEKAD